MATRCAAWWDISPAATVWQHPISGRALNGCVRWNSWQGTGGVFGSRPVITTGQMSGKKNVSDKCVGREKLSSYFFDMGLSYKTATSVSKNASNPDLFQLRATIHDFHITTI